MSPSAIAVALPTQTSPSHEQLVVGKRSPLTPDLEEFRGIPFGFVPGRWKHSEIRLSLPSDRYDASNNGPKCPQLSEPNNSATYQSHLDFPSDVTESEFECLNLFVVRPSGDALKRIGKEAEKLPALIWIHGGGFGFGAGTDPMWDPGRLVLESISLGLPFIAVCLNYRLNLFGFAASSELLDDQTGGQRQGCNFGLRDQQVGLQWVSRNIPFFGGDSEKITLGGQSAGAASVHTHTLSAKLKPEPPLFRRSIIQSGSLGCLGPSPLDDANRNWDILCKHLGFEMGGTVSRLERLRTLPTEELVRAQRELGWAVFPVAIDDVSITSTDTGYDVLVSLDGGREVNAVNKAPSSESIEILIGDTETEASIFAGEVSNILSFEQVQTIFQEAYPSSLAAKDILDAYRITSEVPLALLRENLTTFVGDVMFGYPISRARKAFSNFQERTGNDNTSSLHSPWSYHPTIVQSYKVMFGNPFPGLSHNVSHHCVELIYLFDAFHDDLVKLDHIEGSLTDQLTPPLSAGSSTVSLDLTGELDDDKTPAITSDSKSVNDRAAEVRTKSNVALSKDIQRHWIEFITKEEIQQVDLGQPSNVDRIKVYGVDREIHMESLSSDNDWVEQRKRFEVLARHPEAMRRVLARLTKQLLI